MANINANQPACADPLTAEQATAIAAWVEQHGRNRARAQGLERFNSADFLTGAMCAFFACASEGKIPPRWIFGLMAGDDPLDIVAHHERILLDAAKVVLQEQSANGKVPNQLTSLRVAVQRLDPGWKPE